MSDDLIQKLRAYALIGIIVLISLVFMLQFGGPQAQGCSQGGGGTQQAVVYGSTVSDGDLRANLLLTGAGQAASDSDKEMVLQGIVDRMLLARQAREMGFDVSEEEVMQRFAKEGTVLINASVDAPFYLQIRDQVPVPVKNASGQFDGEAAKRFIQYQMRRSVNEFAEAQGEEMLARRLKSVVESSVTVSPQEVRAEYVQQTESLKVNYIRYRPRYFEERVQVTEAQVRAWMAEEENAEKVGREFEGNRHRYTNLDKQVRARHILIKVARDAEAPVLAEARAKMDALVARINAGEDFAALARDNSQDPGSARKGGDLGYNPRGRMVPEFDEAQFGLEVGGVSDVVQSQFGFHVIKAVGIREGDVPEDEAKYEIAERLYRTAKSTELARAAAERDLRAINNGTEMDRMRERLEWRSTHAPGARPAEDLDGDGVLDTEPPPTIEASPDAPVLEESSPFGRTTPPVTNAEPGPLLNAAFNLTTDSPNSEIVEASGDLFIMHLLERTDATDEGFTDEVRERISSSLRRQKQQNAIRAYVYDLRKEAERSGEIRRPVVAPPEAPSEDTPSTSMAEESAPT